MGNLKRALSSAIQSPDENTLSALVDAADKSLTSKNIETYKDHLISAIDLATTAKLFDHALALMATIEAVAPGNPDILRRVAECLIKVGQTEAVMGIADQLYAIAETTPARIQAQHLRVKVWAHLGDWAKAKDAQEFLRGLLQDLVEGPLISLEDMCWCMGALFWFGGYFDDYPGDRTLYNLVSEFCLRSVTASCT